MNHSGCEIVLEELSIPTYTLESPDPSPVYNRLKNHQNTKGDSYPLAMIDRLTGEKEDRTYQSIRLENDYIRVVVLPELGGRIYEGYDKSLQYHFVYKNNVIKPAMIGICGAWVSGGIEFNWPQHHRPTTFMPVDATIEVADDGSKTVWMGEIEPMYGMKGMIGVTIHPDRSVLTVKTRIYNRTNVMQTFHWWANLAVPVNDQVQLQFPPDVDYVTYHYKDQVSPFPIAHGDFARVDFGEDGADITWPKNIPGPSSFFIFNSNNSFMGGYDHGRKCGTVHVADRHISPGKKFFTWGKGEFGERWQKNLTDDDGDYIEIMTGCYTDNQPDFCFIAPYETKTFEQNWYALDQIPALKNANTAGAIGFSAIDDSLHIALNATSKQDAARVVVKHQDKVIYEATISIGPGQPFSAQVPLEGRSAEDISIELLDASGDILVAYAPKPAYFSDKQPPQPHQPSLAPEAIEHIEQLYLEGLQLEQYRHATRDPESYYKEALRRDPLDVRCNNALGMRALHRGEYQKAFEAFERAKQRLTARNQNPRDGESSYLLGLALIGLHREKDALDAFRKAAWDRAWKLPALVEAARLYAKQGRFADVLRMCDEALPLGADCLQLRALQCAALRHSGRTELAKQIAFDTIALDRLDYSARFEYSLALVALGKRDEADQVRQELVAVLSDKASSWLELAGDYIAAGLYVDAVIALLDAPKHPMVDYYRGYCADAMGQLERAQQWFASAQAYPVDGCFPARDREIAILECAVKAAPQGAHAPYYLGCLYYGRDNATAAIANWEEAVRRDAKLAAAHRCLAAAYHDHLNDLTGARRAMETAFELHQDSRYLFELLQIRKVCGATPEAQLALLEAHRSLVDPWDEIYTSLITLYNRCKNHERAKAMLADHVFHPYEGGEGVLVRQHILTYIFLGNAAMDSGNYAQALSLYQTALEYPENFNEGRKYRAREAHVYVHIAKALDALGQTQQRNAWLERAAQEALDIDEVAYYKGVALRMLGRSCEAAEHYHAMLELAEVRWADADEFPYFAVFPTGLPFEQDIRSINRIACLHAQMYAHCGLGQRLSADKDYEALCETTDDRMWADIIRESAFIH